MHWLRKNQKNFNFWLVWFVFSNVLIYYVGEVKAAFTKEDALLVKFGFECYV